MKQPGILFIFLCTCLTAAAQPEEATTRSGKKVILYPDGRWKYADEATDKPVQKVKEPIKEKEKKPALQPATITPTDCDDQLEVIDESRTGLRITRSKNRMIVEGGGDKGQIGISLQKNSKGILTLFLYPVGAGSCIGEGNRVNIEFTDGSKTEFGHDAFANCLGESSVNFGGNYGKKKQLELLKSKKIKKIRVWTQEGSVQQQLPAEIRDNLQRLFLCLGN